MAPELSRPAIASDGSWSYEHHDLQDWLVSLDETKLSALGIWPQPSSYDFACCFQSSAPSYEKNWAEVLPLHGELGLYVHLPFCSGLCAFCYFTVTVPSDDIVERYTKYLMREIEYVSRVYRGRIVSLYIGGGTPSLRPDLLYLVLQEIARRYTLSEDIEITVELAPEGRPGAIFRELGKIGVNRVSIGAQSLDDDVLRVMRRRHNSRTTLNWIGAALDAGFTNMNVDIIPGFPGFSTMALEATIARLAQADVPGITVYDFETRKEIPLYRKGRPRFRSALEALEDRGAARRALARTGYEEFLCCWFRRDKSVSFQQQEWKWRGHPYVGLGVSAYGFVGDSLLFHPKSFEGYFDAIERGKVLASPLNRLELLARKLYFGLRLKDGVSVSEDIDAADAQVAGSPSLRWLTSYLRSLVELGLVETTFKNKWRLSVSGLLFSDEIAEQFENIAKGERRDGVARRRSY
jgi:oxygen-independent coproporphyrinogen-3 oxidase